jgi:hypothetical protein
MNLRFPQSDQQVQQDVVWILEIHQRVEAETGGVLDLVFAPNTLRQSCVGPDLFAERIDRASRSLRP